MCKSYNGIVREENAKDTSFFATSDNLIVVIKGGPINRINTKMMQLTRKTFKLYRQIPQNEQKDMKPCISCFAKRLITRNLC